MKNSRLFNGTLLLCTGGVFLLESLPIPLFISLLQWPMILLILGTAFLVQGSIGKEQHALFPGVLLFGLGFHLLASSYSSQWPTGWGMYTLILGIAFLTQKNTSFKTAMIIIGISVFTLFYSDFNRFQSLILTYLNGFWPLILIGIGILLLVKRK